MHYSLDRFEEGFALLEGPDGGFVQVLRSQLPPTARQGDLLTQSGGVWQVDAAATAQRREALRRRFAALGAKGQGSV